MGMKQQLTTTIAMWTPEEEHLAKKHNALVDHVQQFEETALKIINQLTSNQELIAGVYEEMTLAVRGKLNELTEAHNSMVRTRDQLVTETQDQIDILMAAQSVMTEAMAKMSARQDMIAKAVENLAMGGLHLVDSQEELIRIVQSSTTFPPCFSSLTARD